MQIHHKIQTLTFTCIVLLCSQRVWAEEGKSPWWIQASAGIPKLSSEKFQVTGEGSIQYNLPRWGVEVQGGTSAYSFANSSAFNENTQYHGSAEFHWSAMPSATTLELRAYINGNLFDTTTVAPNQPIVLEDSTFLRGGFLIGISHEDELLRYRILVGAAIQNQTQSSLRVLLDGSRVDVDDQNTFGFTGTNRMDFMWIPKSDTFGLRFHSDSKLFGIRRDALAISILQAKQVNVNEEAVSSLQFQTSNRLGFDFRFACVLGFCPELAAGADVYFLSQPQSKDVTFVPSIFIGILRPDSW
jgi:hypothetical protein